MELAVNTKELVLESLLSQIGISRADSGGPIEIVGSDPVVPSRHRPGLASAAALAAQAAAIGTIWKMRTGRSQEISVDLLQAAIPGLRTVRYLVQNGHSLDFFGPQTTAPNFFATRDDRRIYLLRFPTYPKHLRRLLELLGCTNDSTEAMSNAVRGWNAVELEDALAERRLVGAVSRQREEWLAHPQGRWLAERPVIHIEKLGDSPPEPFLPASRPLSGVRVLDMTHVLAGPTCSRVLAEQGADVLHVEPPNQPDGLTNALDTGLGKRSAYIDLDRPDDVQVAQALAREADIFVQSWRPGSLDGRGFSPERLARHRPGIIYVSVSCYGSGGPWRTRGGYDPVGQTVCGLAMDEGSPDRPQMTPTFTLNDYLAAYLASAGALGALVRRAREGGSYHVQISLTRCSMWLQELGQLPAEQWPDRSNGMPPLPTPRPSNLMSIPSAFGTLQHAAPIARYSETKAFWALPPAPAGSSRAEWLPR